MSTSDRFGDITDLLDPHPLPGALVECMVHLDDSERGHADRALLAGERLARVLEDYELVGHAEIAHA